MATVRSRWVLPLSVVWASMAMVEGGCGGDVPTNYLKPPGAGGQGGGSGSGGKTSSAGSPADGGGAAGEAGEPGQGGASGSNDSGGSGLVTGGKGGITSTAGTSGSVGSGGESGSGPVEPCGNDELDEGEECDDGNQLDGDGCSSLCTASCELCEAFQVESMAVNECALGPYCLEGVGPEDVALAGPAASKPRNELCLDLLGCIRRSNCAADPAGEAPPAAINCYCGDSFTGGDCSMPTGVCKTEVEWAAESAEFGTIATRFNDASYALGRAMPLIDLCDAYYCSAQCFEGAAWLPPDP